MKENRWFGFIVSIVLILSIFYPTGAFAENNRTLEDESIYDLLVDRYNNGDYENDLDIDTRDMSAFSGGDFAGIVSRLQYLVDLGFTSVSLGPIFSTATYDGSEVLDYGKLEPHFGTDGDLKEMINALHEKEIGVIADFPMSGVSENHVWVKDGTLPSTPAAEGTVDWDSSDAKVKEMLKGAIISFIQAYDLDGIRLTKLADFDEDFLNEVIAEIKEVNADIYVISTEISPANFDTVPHAEKIDALRQAYVQIDPDTSQLELFEDNVGTDFIQFDELTGARFTYDMLELRMFPPTRWKLAATALFTLPGIPVMPYGSEIAVNGEGPPESHPISNFKTDMELNEYIADLNQLRNESETFRNGDLEVLQNEDGFTVFKRSSEEETWIIAINNTSEVASIEITEDIIGENKRMRGVLDGDSVKQGKDGVYRIVLEREIAEAYFVEEDKGFNWLYLSASILIFGTFFVFLFIMWRKGKKRAKEVTE